MQDPDKVAQRKAFTYNGVDLHDRLLKRNGVDNKSQVSPTVLNLRSSNQPTTQPEVYYPDA